MLLLTTLALSFLVGLLLLGIGSIVQFALRQHRDPLIADGLTALWLGWAGLLAWLQLWHLLRPVDTIAWSATAVLALTGLALRWTHWRGIQWPRVANAGPALLLFAAAVLLALRARGDVENYDTGLYHLDSVRWIEHFASVPGLGNLHGRLAFNSSHFLFGAWCDQIPLAAGEGHHFAHGPLILLLLATGLAAAGRLFQSSPLRLADLFFTATLVPALELALASNVTGYSPDLSVFILGLGVLGTTLRLFDESPAEAGTVYQTLVILFVAGVTIKINFIFVGAPLFVIATVRYVLSSGPALRASAMLLFLGVSGLVWIGPWLARGIISSGYPAYPLTLSALPVDWKVPVPIAHTEAMVVSTWAREPGPFWANIGVFADWFPGWLQRLSTDFRMQAATALTVGCFWLLTTTTRHPRLRRRWQAALVASCVVSIAAWFALAPDIRFAGASWPALTILCGLFIFTRLSPASTRFESAFPLIALALVLTWGVSRELPSRVIQAFQNYRDNLAALPQPHITTRTTASGLVLNLPTDGIQTWGVELPATHLFREDLELRTPGRLDRGFRVTRPLEHLDGVGQRAAADLVVPDGYAGRFLDGWGRPEKDGTRWMQTPGRLLLFAPGSGVLQLRLKTGWIDVGGEARTASALACYVNDRLAGSIPLRRGEITRLNLTLHQGFNLIAFTFDDNPPSKIVFRHIKDQRGAANLAFQSVQLITTMPQPPSR